MLQEATAEFCPPNLTNKQTPSGDGGGQNTAAPDIWGVSGSVLCLIHCIAPQLITLGTIGMGLQAFFESGIWIAFFWLTCLASVWYSARQTVFLLNGLLLWAAFLVFSLGLLAELRAHDNHFFSMSGSGLLILAHSLTFFRNRTWKRRLRVLRNP